MDFDLTDKDKVLSTYQRQLVLDNLKLVDYVIHRKFGIHTDNQDYEDIRQEGYYALCLACLRFDESLGYKISTYATSYIYFHLQKYFKNTNLLKIPRRIYENKTIIAKEKIKNPDISLEDLMKKTGLSSFDILETNYTNDNNLVELDSPVQNEEDNLILGEVIPSEENVEENVEYEITINNIDYLLNQINFSNNMHYLVFQEYIYDRIYDEPMSQLEYSKKYNISQPNFSIIIRKYSKQLRELLTNERS